jgi:hypothetical protein
VYAVTQLNIEEDIQALPLSGLERKRILIHRLLLDFFTSGTRDQPLSKEYNLVGSYCMERNLSAY